MHLVALAVHNKFSFFNTLLTITEYLILLRPLLKPCPDLHNQDMSLLQKNIQIVAL